MNGEQPSSGGRPGPVVWRGDCPHSLGRGVRSGAPVAWGCQRWPSQGEGGCEEPPRLSGRGDKEIRFCRRHPCPQKPMSTPSLDTQVLGASPSRYADAFQIHCGQCLSPNLDDPQDVHPSDCHHLQLEPRAQAAGRGGPHLPVLSPALSVAWDQEVVGCRGKNQKPGSVLMNR